MMNRKPTPQLNRKELELISAYLDGQLPEAQRQRLRQRLAQDAAFKQVFEDIRLTRLALRSAPQIKRRRSFTLTPEMVGQRRRAFGLQQASRLVAVVATVLLTAVFAGDVFFFKSGVQSFSLLSGGNMANEAVVEDSADFDMLESEPSGGGGEQPMFAGQAVEDEEAADEPAEAEAAPAMVEPAAEEGDDTAALETADESDEEGRDGDAADSEARPVGGPGFHRVRGGGDSHRLFALCHRRLRARALPDPEAQSRLLGQGRALHARPGEFRRAAL